MYILRVCKLYGFSANELDILFNGLITSLFMFGAEVWGCAAHSKYLVQIDRLLNRVFTYEYVQKRVSILDIIHDRNLSLWNRITSGRRNGLEELLLQIEATKP